MHDSFFKVNVVDSQHNERYEYGSFVDNVPHCAFFLRIKKSQFSLIFSGSGDLYICICLLSTPSSADLSIYHRVWGC